MLHESYLVICVTEKFKERLTTLRSKAWRAELAGHPDQRERLLHHQATNQTLLFGGTVPASVTV